MALPVFASPTNTADTLVYTVPDGKKALLNSLNVSALLAASVKIAITPGVAPTAAHWLETGRVLAQFATLERTNLLLAAGNRVYITSSVANALSVQIFGIEE